MDKDTIYRQDAIDAIVKCTNCNTPEVLKEYVAEHSLWSLWSGGVLEALEAVEALPPATLYTPDEIQTMQDLEWSQMEKMYELGKEERKKGKWDFIGNQLFKCTSCEKVYSQDQFYALQTYYSDPEFPNFCPNCGADMREGDAE